MHSPNDRLRRGPRGLRRFFASLFVLSLLLSLAIAAEAKTRAFDVASDDAVVSLRRFTEQSGQEIVYAADVVRGVKTNAVKGDLSPQDAIDAMLSGTPLVAKQSKRGVLTITRAPADPNGQGAVPVETSSRPSPSRASGAAAATDSQTVQMDPFRVTSESNKGWGATQATGATRLLTSLLETPMSLSVINRELMDTVGARNGYDALRWVSGLGPAAQRGIGAYSLRGNLPRLDSTGVIDGLPGLTVGEVETEFVERWEVVKGAAGTLFGEHDIGGLINRVYKTPLRERRTNVRGSFSSEGSGWQGSIDTTGSLGTDTGLAYRAILVRGAGGSMVGNKNLKKAAYYGTVEYTPARMPIKLWTRFEYRDLFTPEYESATMIDGAGNSSFPQFGRTSTRPWHIHSPHNIFRYYEFGMTSRFTGWLGDWSARFVMRFNDDHVVPSTPIMGSNAVTMVRADGSILGTITGNSVAPGQARWTDPWAKVLVSDARASDLDVQYTNRRLFFDLTGDFATGPVSHKVLIYTQAQERKVDFRQWFMTVKPEFGGNTFRNNLVLQNCWDYANPKFVSDPWSIIVPGSRNQALWTISRASRFNAGIQDNIYLFDNRLLVVGGLRYDYLENLGDVDRVNNSRLPYQENTNVVSKVSVVYRPLKDTGLALYANRSETFAPQFGETFPGSRVPLKNQEGITEEVGAKWELFDQRLIGSVAYFESRVTNLVIFFFNPATGFNENLQSGVSPSKGWDADLTWSISDSWTALVAMSNIDSKDFRGFRLRNVMNDFNYKMLVRWSAPRDSRVPGLSVGAGVVKLGSRQDATNTFIIPGFAQYEAFASYRRGNWSAQVNVKNLTDTFGTESLTGRFSLWVNQPRTLEISADYQF